MLKQKTMLVLHRWLATSSFANRYSASQTCVRCSIQDVLRRDELIALRPSGYTWTFFQTSRDPVIQQLQKNLVPFVENSVGKIPAGRTQPCHSEKAAAGPGPWKACPVQITCHIEG